MARPIALPDEQRMTDRFAAFCELAAEFGLGANLEPMPWTDVRDFMHGARIVERAASDNAALLIDPRQDPAVARGAVTSRCQPMNERTMPRYSRDASFHCDTHRCTE
jgi:hypothetical protein